MRQACIGGGFMKKRSAYVMYGKNFHFVGQSFPPKKLGGEDTGSQTVQTTNSQTTQMAIPVLGMLRAPFSSALADSFASDFVAEFAL